MKKICIICKKPKTEKQSGSCPVELDYQEVHLDCWLPSTKKGKELKKRIIKLT